MPFGDVALELVTVLAPAGAAWAGVVLGMRSQRERVALEERVSTDRELRELIDEAVRVLEIADQKRGMAVDRFRRDGTKTTPAGVDAINAFRNELGKAAQLRHQLGFRTEPGSPVYSHFEAAFDALGKASMALGLAAQLPPDEPSGIQLGALYVQIRDADEAFPRERDAFVAASQIRLASPGVPHARLTAPRAWFNRG